jgi:hypothetical protein
MRRSPFDFWFVGTTGAIAFIWLFAELVRVLRQVIAQQGAVGIIIDGVIQHKIGEILVAAPLFLLTLLSDKWSKDKLLRLVSYTEFVMVAGGLLNALAWFNLGEQEDWTSFFRIWCLVLFVTGFFGAFIGRWFVRKAKSR